MAHLALYRKYRPSGFEHLLGQDHIKKTLLNAINHNSISHAYLFSGPRGTGKTSSAKLFAKAVSCTSGTNGEPCGKCDICSDSNPDIIEIDAASNNGVDEIRDLRDKIGYSPVYGKYKVYIIDEVHMLTIGAFNALLKTLEEPPSHAIFILATTEPHKIPLTILSRLQRYDFKRITSKTIVERMKFIIKNENVEVEEEALEIIARVAQGGMRDALSLLDQALAHANGKVKASDVIELTGTVDLSKISHVIKAIDKNETSMVLDLLDEIIETGKEPKFFLDDLLAYYRDMLVYRRVGDKANLTKALTDQEFKEVAKTVNEDRIYSIIDILSKCQSQIKYSGQDKVILEVALIKACSESSKQDELAVLRKEIMALKTMISNGEIPPKQSEHVNNEEIWKGAESVELSENEIKTIFKEAEQISEQKDDTNEPKENQKQSENSMVEENKVEQVAFDLLAKIESDLSQEKQEEISDSKENGSESVDKQEKLSKEPVNFLEQIQKDIKEGADYVQVVDDSYPALDHLAPPENIEDSKREPEFTSEKWKKVFDVLKVSKREYRVEYKEKNSLILSTLKQERMSIMTLYREAMVQAISAEHIVVTYKMKPQVKLLEKVMNRSIVQSILGEILGRWVELIVLEESEWLNIKNSFIEK